MQVPVPVVVMVPQIFDTTELLSAGSTTIYLTNVGLFAADDVTLALPSLPVCLPHDHLPDGSRELASAVHAFRLPRCRLDTAPVLHHAS